MEESKGTRLCVFDFDGTMTEKDTMLEFVRFVKGSSALYTSLAVLSPLLVLMKLGLYSRTRVKEQFLSWHFKGATRAELKQHAVDFCREVLPNLLRPKALDQMHHHRYKKHRVLVITASLDIWLTPWMQHHALECLSTQAEFVNDVFTGKLASPNLYGPEKVKALLSVVNPKDYDLVIVYGDSRGDRELLELANRKFYKPFRNYVPPPKI